MWLLVTVVLLAGVPSIAYSERQPTRQKLDSEIFRNVSFPSVVLGTLLAIKEDPEDHMQDMKQATFMLKNTIDLTLKEQHAKFTTALFTEMELSSKTRYQRMLLYQLSLAAFLSGLESGGQGLTGTFVGDEFISRLAAKGWEFEPYKP